LRLRADELTGGPGDDNLHGEAWDETLDALDAPEFVDPPILRRRHRHNALRPRDIVAADYE
jgi:hypothetical protein